MEFTNLNKERKLRRKSGSLELGTMMFGKIPPQAKDLEEAVLGAIMLEKNAFDFVIEILKPECFYVEANQRIFRAMQGLQQKNSPIDLLTVVEELKFREELDLTGGPFYVTRLTNSVVSSANIEAHARIVLQKFIQRELIRISGEIIGDAYEDSTDVFDLLDDAETKLFEITNNHLRKDYASIDTILVRTIQRIEDLRTRQDEITGVPTGFSLRRTSHAARENPLNPGPTHIQRHLHPRETGRLQTCILVWDRRADFFTLKPEIHPCRESNSGPDGCHRSHLIG